MAQAKKGLGRGLSALIPTDMDFLAEVARGDFSVLASPNPSDEPTTEQPVSRETADSISESVLSEALEAEDKIASPFKSAEFYFGARDNYAANKENAVLWATPDSIVANPYQPRRTFDEVELQSLSESIREHGVLQPIIVRPIALGPGFTLDAEQIPGVHYQLIAGERRWRASQVAGLERVPVIVREVSDQQALELAIIENVQRHDISALDAAIAYKRLAQEFGLSQESIARRVGKSRSSVANTIRLLDLPPEAQTAIQEGAISEGHGRAILLAPGDGARRATLRAVLRGRLSVRQAEDLAGRIARQAERDAAQAEIQDATSTAPDSEHSASRRFGHETPLESEEVDMILPHDEDSTIEEQLQRALSCRVQIKRRRAGGQVVLFAHDAEQLDRILETLGRL